VLFLRSPGVNHVSTELGSPPTSRPFWQISRFCGQMGPESGGWRGEQGTRRRRWPALLSVCPREVARRPSLTSGSRRGNAETFSREFGVPVTAGVTFGPNDLSKSDAEARTASGRNLENTGENATTGGEIPVVRC